jgi:hypothetical protein
VARTRYSEHFADYADPGKSGGLQVGGPTVRIAMLNCGVPAVQKYSSLVPTFTWRTREDQKHDHDNFAPISSFSEQEARLLGLGEPSFRSGRQSGYRLYLSIADGFSSGADALIGIAAAPKEANLSDPRLIKDLRNFATSWGCDPTLFRPGQSETSVNVGPTPDDFLGYRVFLPTEIANLAGFVRELLSPQTGASELELGVSKYLLENMSANVISRLRDETFVRSDNEKLRRDIADEMDRLFKVSGRDSLFEAFASDTEKRAIHGPIARACWCRQLIASAYSATDSLLRIHLFDTSTRTFKKFTMTNKDSNLESSYEYEVIPYLPQYEEETGSWYIDVECRPPAEYTFIQFSLVTYQAHSIPGCHVSPIQRADMVQLLPNRWLSVCRGRGGDSLHIRVTNFEPIVDRTPVSPWNDRSSRIARTISFQASILKADDRLGAVVDDDLDGGFKTLEREEVETPVGVIVYHHTIFNWAGKKRGARRLVVEERRVTQESDHAGLLKTESGLEGGPSSSFDDSSGKLYFDILEI